MPRKMLALTGEETLATTAKLPWEAAIIIAGAAPCGHPICTETPIALASYATTSTAIAVLAGRCTRAITEADLT
jgi:hypothetical protein